MASAERRAPYRANYFTQDFRIPLNSSDRPSSVSKDSASDRAPGNAKNDQIRANSDKLPDMKWWLHVKSNMGGEADYTSQNLNSCKSELGAFYAEFLDGNVKSVEEQSVMDFDALSYTESTNLSVEQPWHYNNTRMPKIEASLTKDLHVTPKKKDQMDFCFLDDHFADSDISSFLVSEQGKITSSDLESHLVGADKTGPWWRTAGKDELASLVAQKSMEHIENCDLPNPQTRHFRQRASHQKGFDQDKTTSSPSLNQKTESGSSNADGYTSGTPSSGCSFQDSNEHFSSSSSKDSGSSNKDFQTNSEKRSMAELLEALCHSQTRAREAEKAAQQAYNEKEHIVSLFFRQASQLFAYKQWIHLLQLENLCLQLRNKNQPLLSLFPSALPRVPSRGMLHKKSHGRGGKKKSCNRRCGIRNCVVAFAVGLGLAGAGLLLGWTLGWMFPTL